MIEDNHKSEVEVDAKRNSIRFETIVMKSDEEEEVVINNEHSYPNTTDNDADVEIVNEYSGDDDINPISEREPTEIAMKIRQADRFGFSVRDEFRERKAKKY
jgi:hypothetical protein